MFFELSCFVVIVAYVIGFGHIAFLNGYFWFLDHLEGLPEPSWGWDTFMTTIFVPLAFVLTATELYLLYGNR